MGTDKVNQTTRAVSAIYKSLTEQPYWETNTEYYKKLAEKKGFDPVKRQQSKEQIIKLIKLQNAASDWRKEKEEYEAKVRENQLNKGAYVKNS